MVLKSQAFEVGSGSDSLVQEVNFYKTSFTSFKKSPSQFLLTFSKNFLRKINILKRKIVLSVQDIYFHFFEFFDTRSRPSGSSPAPALKKLGSATLIVHSPVN